MTKDTEPNRRRHFSSPSLISSTALWMICARVTSIGELCLHFYPLPVLLRERISFCLSDTSGAWSMTHSCNGSRCVFEGPWADVLERKKEKNSPAASSAATEKYWSYGWVAISRPFAACLPRRVDVFVVHHYTAHSAPRGGICVILGPQKLHVHVRVLCNVISGEKSDVLYQQQTVPEVVKDNR